MSYDENHAVRLDGADLEFARTSAANAVKEIQALGRLVMETLGRAEEMDGRRPIGVEIRMPTPAFPAVYTLCDWTTGECLGVWDDLAGICRPCGPGDIGCTPHPHVTEPEVLPE